MATSILDNRDLAGPYRLPRSRQPAIEQEIHLSGLSPINFLAQAPSDASGWLKQLGAALNFPADFGCNFDALYDALCDREILPQQKLVIIIENTDALGEEKLDTLIAVLQAAADEWRDEQRSLWSLFTGPGIDLDALPAAKA